MYTERERARARGTTRPGWRQFSDKKKKREEKERGKPLFRYISFHMYIYKEAPLQKKKTCTHQVGALGDPCMPLPPQVPAPIKISPRDYNRCDRRLCINVSVNITLLYSFSRYRHEKPEGRFPTLDLGSGIFMLISFTL
jgi:hypothetical protein